ncbi:MAG: NAD(P)/FAD-dependent oxidoreductase [Candidatus Limnocylindrales bacterium]
MATTGYDAIIVGGGHNGLVCAAYLARAGLRPLVLEARGIVGGASVTQEPWPGYRISTLAYVSSLLLPRIVRELELERHGYHVWEMSPDYFVPFPDGRHIMIWADTGKSAAEIRRFSERDALAYPRFDDFLSRMAMLIRPLLETTPPAVGSRKPGDLVDQVRFAARFAGLGARGVGELVKLMTQSTADLLDDWFESDDVKTALCSQGAIGAYGGPYMPGTAYVLLHHWMGEINGHLGAWGVVRGGMGAISEAIASNAREHGAEIRVDARVARVLTEDGPGGPAAIGVVLETGEEIRAPIIASSAHPQITFLRLLDRSVLPGDFVGAIERIRSRSGTVKINLGIGELPDFTALPGTTVGPQHSGSIELCHSMAYLERAYDDAKEGRPSARPYSEMVIPTVYDRSIAPGGKHVVSLFSQYVPGSWAAEDHRVELEAFADRVIDELTLLAPNFRGSIEHREVIGPYEMEHEYGLIGGSIQQGDLTLDQMLSWRPVAGYANYRTPVRQLYLCGSGAHPGGGVMGAPGMNAAREIVADLQGGAAGTVRRGTARVGAGVARGVRVGIRAASRVASEVRQRRGDAP